MKVLSNRCHHLGEIFRHFDEGRWHLPSHQRLLAWDKKKIKEWFRDIKAMYKNGGGEVPGCVIVYELPGDPKVYMNDGAQRAYWTIKLFIDECKRNGEDWEKILMSVQITVQRVEYKNVQEAIKNFIRINFGTTATPYELTRTMFCAELDDFKDFWDSRLDKVHNTINDALLFMNCKIEDSDEPDKRELSHKRRRDEFHMFWKFLSKDKTQWSPQVALSTLRSDQWDKQTQLEQRLLDEIINCGHSGIDDKVEQFKTFIERYTAYYKQIWNEVMPKADRPANVHFRWWLSCAIYCRNNNISDGDFREFTKKLISHSEGRTSIFYFNKEGKQCNSNTAMSKLQQVGMIGNILNVSLNPKEQRKQTDNRLLQRGFVKSHKGAFSHHGDGPTLAENAVDNAHRSARDMTDEEVERLAAVN